MKITILDAQTLGSDICLDKFREYGELEIFDTTPKELTAERIKESDIVVTNKVILTENEVKNAKNLKLICITATGTNNVDLEYMASHNIKVKNVAGYSTQSVAQFVFAYMLSLMCNLEKYNNYTHQNLWQKSPTFTCLDYPIDELEGKTLGIVGYGNIGKKVEQIALAFGMKVIIAKLANRNYSDNKERVEFDEFLKQSDVISLHCPLSKQTEKLFGKEEFAKMKNTAIFINTSRGPVVDIDALYQALKNGQIAKAAIDVYNQEPPKEHPIFQLENIIITPHIAWATKEARIRLLELTIKNIAEF